MSDYPEEFEKIWKQRVPSRLSGRKEAGFVVYSRMTKEITQLKEQLAEAESMVRRLDRAMVQLWSKVDLQSSSSKEKDHLEDMVHGLTSAADDYFTKYKKQES